MSSNVEIEACRGLAAETGETKKLVEVLQFAIESGTVLRPLRKPVMHGSVLALTAVPALAPMLSALKLHQA